MALVESKVQGRHMDSVMGTKYDDILDFSKLIPQPGMAVTIINRGDVYQLIQHYLVETPTMPMLELTEEDVMALSRGEITFQ